MHIAAGLYGMKLGLRNGIMNVVFHTVSIYCSRNMHLAVVLLYPAIRHTAGILLEGFAFIMLTCKGNETCSPGLFLNVEPLFLSRSQGVPPLVVLKSDLIDKL